MRRVLRSLHARLVVLLFVLLGLAWLLVLGESERLARSRAASDIDQSLENTARSVLTAVAWRAAEADTRPPRPNVRPEVALASEGPEFEVVSVEGRILARSSGFPANLPASHTPGYRTREAGGIEWRVLTTVDRQRGLVGRVAIETTRIVARRRLLQKEFTGPLVWVLPVLGVIVLASVWQGLTPLRRLRQAIALQDPVHPAPLGLEPDRMPTEVAEPVVAIDRLLERLDDVLARLRSFTAATGHELRTPLSGLKVQAQLAARAEDPVDRQRALSHIRGSVDRLERLVNQLLLLARLEPGAPAADTEPVDIASLAVEVTANRQVTARRQGIKLEGPERKRALMVNADPALLESLLGNLLDNALRFSPDGGTVSVAVSAEKRCARITISDQGPGLPTAERERVFEGFYQHGDDRAGGSGLGLAIARGIASAHGGSVYLTAGADGGTVAVVDLPLRPAADGDTV